jgi:hypothetical protein
VAVDRVQSEPEKFSAFAPKLSHWIYKTYGSLVRSGPVRNRQVLISYQGMIIP